MKNVILVPAHSPNRLSLTLKDSSVVIFEKIPVMIARKLKDYLDGIKQGKQTGMFELLMQFKRVTNVLRNHNRSFNCSFFSS